MKMVEFGRLSDEQHAELAGEEDDPWGAAEFDVEWLPKDHHVAITDDDGRLLAAAGLVVVEVRFGAQPPISVVGVGDVIVTASHRGRGFGRQVISEVLKRAEELGPEIAMLFCRAEMAGLYQAHGFAKVSRRVVIDQPAGLTDGRGVMMWRPLKAGVRLPDGIVTIVGGLPF
jgi:predicted GNAT family N-acyltransferase